MQGMTRNPLADPGLLGLTSGANAALAVTNCLDPFYKLFGYYDCLLYRSRGWRNPGVWNCCYKKRRDFLRFELY